MDAYLTAQDTAQFTRLAQAIAAAVYKGPVDAVRVPPGVDSVIADYKGARVQLLRAYDILIDQYQYRCFMLRGGE